MVKAKNKAAPAARRRSRRPRLKRLNRRGLMGLSDMVSIQKPIAMAAAFRSNAAAQKHIEGPACEFLGVVKSPAGDSQGQILYSLMVSPFLMSNTRLSALAGIYSQYKFTKFWVEYLPAAPTTADGSICIAIDKNIDASVNSTGEANAANLAYVLDVDRSVTVPVYQPARIDADCSIATTRQRMFFTSPDSAPDESIQFRVLVATVIENTTLTSGFSFILKVGYTCEFVQPINTTTTFYNGVNYSSNAGATVTIEESSGYGTISGVALPNGASTNGVLYYLNPSICSGLASGMPCITAAAISTKADGTVPRFAWFKDVETARSSTGANPGNGSVQGSVAGAAGVPLPGAIRLVSIGKIAMGYHT